MLPSWLLEVVSLIALENQWLEVGRWHDIFRLKWALFWGHVNICGGIWNVPCVHEFVPLDFKVHVLFTRSWVDGPVTRERERENLCKFERPQKMIKSLQSDVTGRIIATLTGPNLTPDIVPKWSSNLVSNWTFFHPFLLRECGCLHRPLDPLQASGLLKEGLDLSFYLSQVRVGADI